MFNRAVGLPSICLRCQLRLIGRNRPRGPPNPSELAFHCRRWHGAVTAHAENHYEDSRSLRSYERQEDQHTVEHGSNETEESVDWRGRREFRRNTRYRRWRPHQAEGLGLDVLGKPAEVLILPTRNRKASQPMPGVILEKVKGDLQDSLDLELKPVSAAEIMKNIDSFRADIERNGGVFASPEWTDCITRLSHGFTKLQLQNYLRAASSTSQSRPKDVHQSTSDNKKVLAAEIMTHLWKWKEQDSSNDASQETVESPGMTINVSVAKLDFIMMYEKQHLGTLSEELGVQIDIFRSKHQIQIGGPPDSVKYAATQLGQFLDDLHESTLKLPQAVRKALGRPEQAQASYDALMHKHKLFILRTTGALTIVSRSRSAVDVIFKDLLLLASQSHSAPFSLLGEDTPELLAHIPIYPDGLPYHLQQNGVWYRRIARTPDTDDDKDSVSSQRRAARKLADDLLKSMKSSQVVISQFHTARGSVNHECVADLGQAIFNSRNEKSASDVGNKKLKPKPLFIFQPAFLPQLFTKKEFRSSRSGGGSLKDSSPDSLHPFLLRLRLRPVAPGPHSPPFELFLKGRNIEHGLDQHFELKKANAVLHQWQHILLLPHQPVDVRMTRKMTVDLLGNEKTQPSKAHLKILDQMASYLNQSQTADQLILPPVWSIDVSPILKQDTVPKKSNDLIESRDESPIDGSQNKSNQAAIESKSADNPKNMTEYVLEPPEYLDIKSYTSSMCGDRYIDHIICDTDPVDSPAQRQLLQIRDRSLSDLVVDNPVKNPPNVLNDEKFKSWFSKSVTMAHDLATMLRDEGKVKRSVSSTSTVSTSVPNTV